MNRVVVPTAPVKPAERELPRLYCLLDVLIIRPSRPGGEYGVFLLVLGRAESEKGYLAGKSDEYNREQSITWRISRD
eukprot:1327387-Amorphochlora_amoeboformis.AAC.1